MKIVTILGDDVTIEVPYLEDIELCSKFKVDLWITNTVFLQNFLFNYFLWVKIYLNQIFIWLELFKNSVGKKGDKKLQQEICYSPHPFSG